uniref:Fibronectin type III domain-containing protein n=1 Tax=Candidatus Kentrum sp. DK TaxID=2126562 RepID=A0A450S9K1_9GAMM|nr:MAG: Fibronectin type III domain-containing protein [Candidatus Kentron sp. DK]
MPSSKFPRTGSGIIALGHEMVIGFTENKAIYPDPPVEPKKLEAEMAAYTKANDIVVKLQAQIKQALEDRDVVQESLVTDMKTDIRYAENTVHYDDTKLRLIGWSGRHAPTGLTQPGQVRDLSSPDRGPGRIDLQWRAPADGGKTVAYRIQRREQDQDIWIDAGTALDTAARVENQEQGKRFEFCVVAINKAGDGMPSNTITATL